MNGKGEWGTNLVPRATFDPGNNNSGGNKLNRNRRHQESGNSGNTDMNSDLTFEPDDFSMQFSQRKKRKREDRQHLATLQQDKHVATPEVSESTKVGNSIPEHPGVASVSMATVCAIKKAQKVSKKSQSMLCIRNGKLSFNNN